MITLLGKPGCHLCDEARAVIVAFSAETGTPWREVSILDDPDLAEEHWERIPVVFVDDREIAFWRVTPDLLRRAIG